MKKNPKRPRLMASSLAVVAAMACAAPLTAQVSPGAMPGEFASDSMAWQRVLTHIVEFLSGTVVRASHDPAPQPWVIRVPAEDPQALLLESQLETILRARPVAGADTTFHTLELESLRIAGDTAHVVVRTALTRRCPDSSLTAGFANVDSVFVPRTARGNWGAARSKVVVHGDRLPCETSR